MMSGRAPWEEINDGIAGSNYGWPTTEPTSNPSSDRQFLRMGGPPATLEGARLLEGRSITRPVLSFQTATLANTSFRTFAVDGFGYLILRTTPPPGSRRAFQSG